MRGDSPLALDRFDDDGSDVFRRGLLSEHEVELVFRQSDDLVFGGEGSHTESMPVRIRCGEDTGLRDQHRPSSHRGLTIIGPVPWV